MGYLTNRCKSTSFNFEEDITEEDILQKFDENTCSRMLSAINITLGNYKLYNRYPPPPYSKFEIRSKYSFVQEFISKLQQSDNKPGIVRNYINNANIEELLLLQGIRSTEGTIYESYAIPDLDQLMQIATEEYNEYLTNVARARAKHAFRCTEQYWGTISGSPNRQNQDAEVLVEDLFQSFTWWNYFGHFKHNYIFELRDPTGHGMRWDLSNESFLGLVEPVDPNKGRLFFEHREDMPEMDN